MNMSRFPLLDKASRKVLKGLIKADKEGLCIDDYIKSRLDEHVTMVPNTVGLVVWPTLPNRDDEYEKLKETFDRLLEDGYLYKRPDRRIDLSIKGRNFFKIRYLALLAALLSLAAALIPRFLVA